VPIAKILTYITSGVAEPGPVSATGVRIGDTVITAMAVEGDALAAFEPIVTVDDFVQQTAAVDLTGIKLLLQVARE